MWCSLCSKPSSQAGKSAPLQKQQRTLQKQTCRGGVQEGFSTSCCQKNPFLPAQEDTTLSDSLWEWWELFSTVAFAKDISFPASLLCSSAEPGWAAGCNGIRTSCGTQDHVVMSSCLVPLTARLQLALPGTMSSACKCISWYRSAWLGLEEETEKKSLGLDSSCLYEGV